jgi:hypothetical protein
MLAAAGCGVVDRTEMPTMASSASSRAKIHCLLGDVGKANAVPRQLC